MIPLHLSISGFLSYRDQVDLDLSNFHLACISGANGAGKSSLLDAITWSLFGIARKRDESVINLQSNSAEVTFTFSYEGDVYRVQRAIRRGKTGLLELHIQLPATDDEPARWRPLTEKGMRETQQRIEQTLRMDYETFVNASFFLQGRADQFTQQRPGDRKRILGSILGLEIWEVYKERAITQRKTTESSINTLDGSLAEIQAELNEEQARKSRLEELEQRLSQLSKTRSIHEKALESTRKAHTRLDEQARLVEMMERQLAMDQRRLASMLERRSQLEEQRQSYAELIARSAEIEAALHEWQRLRQELSQWEETAARFRQHDARRQAPLTEIEVARGKLEQEQRGLKETHLALESQLSELGELSGSINQIETSLEQYEISLQQRTSLQAEMESAIQNQAEARAENPRLQAEMKELKERINQLSAVEGAACPLCGQPLSEADRQAMVAELNLQGTQMGDKFRLNDELLKKAIQVISDLDVRLKALSHLEQDRLTQTQALAKYHARLEQIKKSRADWDTLHAPRLGQILQALQQNDFAHEARAQLADIDAELKEIGYDAAAHDAVRQAELQQRSVEGEFSALEKARAALAPLENELTNLAEQITGLEAETALRQSEANQAVTNLAAERAQLPDLNQSEQELLSLREQENIALREVGAARQNVQVLDDLKKRKAELTLDREAKALLVGQYRQLERAFGKDGVPALLIEQALPQIENRANELLDRLSGGSMSVRFRTQAEFKDKKRDDLRETLDILISDSAGMRDYELYSGGEAFRVNFAVRLALSEVLAQRAGARLQTLVIDEGFGSQDAQGRQRLIEAINLVEPDFARILVITHIDELKDAFPTRIEVEKGERGSMVRVLQ